MHSLLIRNTATADIPDTLRVYDSARRYMRATGNLSQWTDGYPSADTLRADIAAGGSYAIIAPDGHLAATFFFSLEGEPTYDIIYGGRWLNDEPYGVVHRAASDGTVSGVMDAITEFCLQRCRNLRIDTHADNRPMRQCLQRLGYAHCGTILLANGDERLAYQLSSPTYI